MSKPIAVLLLLLVSCERAAADGTCSATRLNGSSFHGSIGHVDSAKSADSCCAACATTKRCAIWTFSNSGCYLRDNTAKPFANPAAVSGYTSAHVPTPVIPTPPPTPTPREWVPSALSGPDQYVFSLE